MGTKRVLLTGFGPFQEVKANVSWEAVESVNAVRINNRDTKSIKSSEDIQLFKEKIEVRYDVVEEHVPELWTKYQPDLTIHVGVHGESFLSLESQASRTGYTYEDNTKSCPVDNKHSRDGPDFICTELCLHKVKEEFNTISPVEGLKAEVSNCAGKFICEYTYYTSLVHDTQCRQRTLFIHVPVDGCPEQIALCLERIVEICLEQLSSSS